MAEAGERTSKPLELSYSQASPPRCPQGWQKEKGSSRISLSPCGRIKTATPAEWLRPRPEKNAFIRKAARQACGVTGSSRTHWKAGEAPLCARTPLCETQRRPPYFSGTTRPQLEPGWMIIPPPSQLPQQSQSAGREQIRTGPYWLCHPVASWLYVRSWYSRRDAPDRPARCHQTKF